MQHFYIFQIRPSTCGGSASEMVRELQRQIPQGRPDISIMSTTNISGHDGCHYNGTGYTTFADWMYPLVARDFYGYTDTIRIRPPDIQEARFADPLHTRITLRFDQPVLVPSDTRIRNAFAMGNTYTTMDSVKADTTTGTITLFLHAPSDSNTVSYVLDQLNNVVYEDTWLYNTRGIGALTFYRFPVLECESLLNDTTPPTAPTGLTATITESRRVFLAWNPATDNESGISGYMVYRDGIADTTVAVTTATIGNLGELTPYRFSVAAINRSFHLLEGPQTSELLVTTKSDTPSIVYVSAMGDSTLVKITFSEPVENVSATNESNYTIDNGVSVLSAILSQDSLTVTLRTTPLSGNVNYDLSINNIRDVSSLHNPILPNTSVSFTYLRNIPQVLNPGFESPAVSGYQYNPTDPVWTYNGGSGIVQNGSGFGNNPAPNGVQAAFLQNVSSISQTITLGSGKYRVRFKAAQRNRAGNSQTIKVYLDNMELGSFTPTGTIFIEYATDYCIVPGGSYQLKIAGIASTGDNTVFVDEVAIEVAGLSTDNEPAAIMQESLSLVTSPNPFNPSVNIQVAGWRSGMELKILNVSGKVVADLTKVQCGDTGQRQVVWNALGQASGVYLVMLRQGKTEIKRKVMLIR